MAHGKILVVSFFFPNRRRTEKKGEKTKMFFLRLRGFHNKSMMSAVVTCLLFHLSNNKYVCKALECKSHRAYENKLNRTPSTSTCRSEHTQRNNVTFFAVWSITGRDLAQVVQLHHTQLTLPLPSVWPYMLTLSSSWVTPALSAAPPLSISVSGNCWFLIPWHPLSNLTRSYRSDKEVNL